MTKETAHEVVTFIEQHHGDQPVSLDWFGGEPLVGMRRIDQICAELKEKGIAYSSTMISNGYLFDEERIRIAKDEWKLQSIQITLDGTEQVYNQVKSYVGVQGSPFKRVLRNIDGLLREGIHVAVRLNFDRHNGDDISDLIDQLATDLKHKKTLSVYTAALFEDCGFVKQHHLEEDVAWLDKRKDVLDQQIEALGIAGRGHQLPSLWYQACMADNDSSVLIMPNGSLCKCEHGMEDAKIGNLRTNERNQTMLEHLKVPVEYEDCVGCPLLPKCYHLDYCFRPKQCSPRAQAYELRQAVDAMHYCYESSQYVRTVRQDYEGR